MHYFKALLAALSVALLPSCLLGDFDKLEESTQVQSDEKGNLDVTGFGSALIATGGGDGLSYYVVAPVAPTILHVNFAQDGQRTTSPAEDINATFGGVQRLVDLPTVASDTDSFATSGSESVGLGIIDGGQAKVIILNALFGIDQNTLTNIQLNVDGGQEPKSIAFGNTDATTAGTDTTDLVTVSGGQLNLIADYFGATLLTSCSLPTTVGGGKLLVADVDSSTAGAEIIVSNDGKLLVTSASRVESASNADPREACFLDVPSAPQIAAPAGIDSFGDFLAMGDFDGGGITDIVVAAPDSNAVYVYMNWTVQNPTTGIRIPTPGGSVAFGSTLAVGDFDGDMMDELVIGDPKHVIAAHPAAGKAYIFSTMGGTSFELMSTLHDARAQDNQNFGRSLTVASAFGMDKLVVGAKDEVFTYFRTPLSGDVDFRQ